MTHGASGQYAISPPTPQERRHALELLFQAVPAKPRSAHVTRLLADADNGRLSLDGLLLARLGGEIAGVVWLQTQPGRVAILWPPAASRPEWMDCGDCLLRASLDQVAQLDVRLVQSLLPIDAAAQSMQLARHGFDHLADLLYMV